MAAWATRMLAKGSARRASRRSASRRGFDSRGREDRRLESPSRMAERVIPMPGVAPPRIWAISRSTTASWSEASPGRSAVILSSNHASSRSSRASAMATVDPRLAALTALSSGETEGLEAARTRVGEVFRRIFGPGFLLSERGEGDRGRHQAELGAVLDELLPGLWGKAGQVGIEPAVKLGLPGRVVERARRPDHADRARARMLGRLAAGASAEDAEQERRALVVGVHRLPVALAKGNVEPLERVLQVLVLLGTRTAELGGDRRGHCRLDLGVPEQASTGLLDHGARRRASRARACAPARSSRSATTGPRWGRGASRPRARARARACPGRRVKGRCRPIRSGVRRCAPPPRARR